MPDEYPRVMYRPGTQYRVWNEFDCDTMLVPNEAAHKLALEAGWFNDPSGGHQAAGKPPEPEPEPEAAPPAAPQPAPELEPEPASEPEPEEAATPPPLPRKRAYRKRRRKGTLKISKVLHGPQDSAL